jgi:hypothetical protein
MPTPGNIAGRSSSITNAFFNAVIPIHDPTVEEELEALAILGMTPENICCSYCGDPHTEWDHLRPLIRDKEPTGHITEIANLVPACGKCNQSKGGYYWRDWMIGPARLSPKSRNVIGIEDKVLRLERYEAWRKPVWVDFNSTVEPGLWAEHMKNCQDVLSLLGKSQILAKQIRKSIEEATARVVTPSMEGQTTNN